MRLLLTVTSEEKFDLGHRARFEFDETGGTIGRNAACTWVLPDRTNTISSRHATIAHNGRGFVITDTSTNGVYVNTVDAPIGRGNTSVLAPGDTLYLGNYVLSVELIEDVAEERQRLGASPLAASIRAEPSASLPASAPPPRRDAASLMASLANSVQPASIAPSQPAGLLSVGPIETPPHPAQLPPARIPGQAALPSLDALF